MISLLLMPVAAAVNVDFACTPGSGGAIVGVAPLEVRCVVDVPVGSEWGETLWLFGDGSTGSEDAQAHIYTEPGQYSVSLHLLDFVELDSGLPFVTNPSHRADALVNVCGKPLPAFTFIDKGGRDYQLINQSDVSTPHCIDELRWEVFRGKNKSGDPIREFDGWEPRFKLPEDGAYTVVLTLGGVGGTSAASLALDAEYGLTDDIDRSPMLCATGPSPVGWFAGLPLLLVWVRRRG